MRKGLLFPGLSLLAVFLAACAPATSTAISTQPVAVIASETLSAATSTAEPSVQTTVAPTENLPATQLPIATSRGPNLEATDPKTVSMASGGLQFVEFFEFWWTTCQGMAPMVHGLEAKYFGRIKFSYLEISNPLTADFRDYLSFRIRPSFYLLDADGNILHQWIGYQNQDQFEEILAQYVQ